MTVIEKGWKRLSWVLAIFTFAVSAATFVKNFPEFGGLLPGEATLLNDLNDRDFSQ